MKKTFILGITIVSLLFSVLIPVTAEEKNNGTEKDALQLADEAKSAILIERDTGTILYDKNAHDKLPPASMTKIMTLLLIMEALDQGELELDETIRISERAASMGGSQIFLGVGEEMSVDDLIKGIAIASGNDASVALAERISGSEEAFVDKMNEKVAELELENTHFLNSSGLPAKDHYSTSFDMAMIAKELLKYENITSYTSIYDDYLRKGEKNEFWLVNTNKLVKFYPGVDGLKTGFTNEAKYCLTATAMKDDMRVVAVVMGAETVKKRNAIVSQMLDYAFNHFSTTKLFTKGEKVKDIEIIKAKGKNIEIVTSQSISTIHKKGELPDKITTEIVLDEDFSLPIKKGMKKGMLTVRNGEQIISKTPLIVNKDIEQASLFTLLKRSVQRIVKND